MMKVGILGGAFNPPHLAHLALADSAVKAFSLDRLIFIPTAVPPHKELDGKLEFSVRQFLIATAASVIHPQKAMEFLKTLSVNDNRVLEFGRRYQSYYARYHREDYAVSDVESHRTGRSYTIDTVKILLAENPDWNIHWIIGMDQAAVLDTWKDLDHLKRLITFCVADRDGILRGPVQQKFPFVYCFDFPVADIASTQIREALRDGQIDKSILPEITADFFELTGLKP